jgi:SAM-dependent methyltransferase
MEGLAERYRQPAGASGEGRRAERRAARLLSRSGTRRKAWRFLELGCDDGMVSHALARAGKEVVATDVAAEGFDPRLAEAGVEHRRMDPAHLDFPDGSFDVVFSFDALEHFADPVRTLDESARVCRPGGRIYHRSGPLYLSPHGRHAQRLVPVPYCQVLASEETLVELAHRRHGEAVVLPEVNRWTLDAFRRLFERVSDRLELVFYRESRNLEHGDLIAEYPSCFRSRSHRFEDFVVETLEVLLVRH